MSTQTPKPPAPGSQPSGPPAASAPAVKSPFTVGSVARSQRWLNLLVYGEYGVGKTTLAGSAYDVPEMRDVLFLNVEAGDLSLAGYPNIDKIDVNKYATLARAYEFLRRHCQLRDAKDMEGLAALQKQIPFDHEPERIRQYRTVVLDTLTEVSKYVMYQLLSVDVGAKRLDLEPDSPEFKEWNQATEMVRLLIRSLRDLPMHVILVCSSKTEETRPGLHVAGLNLSKALAKELPGFLDVVGYYTAQPNEQSEMVRRLYLSPGRTWMAKHRFGAAVKEAFIEDPKMADLVALLPKGR